jgi:hypothetical protein
MTSKRPRNIFTPAANPIETMIAATLARQIIGIFTAGSANPRVAVSALIVALDHLASVLDKPQRDTALDAMIFAIGKMREESAIDDAEKEGADAAAMEALLRQPPQGKA